MSIYLEECRKIDFQNDEDKYDNIGFDWDYEEMYYRFIAYTEYKCKSGKIDEDTMNELINKATGYEKERRRVVEEKYKELFSRDSKDDILSFIKKKHLECEYDFLEVEKALANVSMFYRHLETEYNRYLEKAKEIDSKCIIFVVDNRIRLEEAKEMVDKIKTAFTNDVIKGVINIIDDINFDALIENYKKELNVGVIDNSAGYHSYYEKKKKKRKH